MDKEPKICLECGKEFISNKHNQKYCCKECTHKANYRAEKERNKVVLPKKICPICGKEFQPHTKAQILCGAEECKKEQNRIRINKFKQNGKATPFTKKCTICGEEFTTTNDLQTLCGKEECFKEREYRRKKGIPEEEYPNLLGVYNFHTKNRTAVCPICGKEFIPNVWSQIYCSRECSLKKVCLDRPNNLYKERECVICGKKFMPNTGLQKTCSEECRKILIKQRKKKLNDTKPRKTFEERVCKYCGEKFTPKYYNQIFCCKEHQVAFYDETNYISEKGKKYYENNKEKIQKKHSEYYFANKEKVLERGRKNRAKRQATDPDYILKKRIREQIRHHLKRYNLTKDFHTFELLGYDVSELYKRLESQFEANSKEGKEPLSWENMGKVWDIDHIVACASFNFANEDGTTNKEEVKKCWRLENVQPMYSDDNRRKSSWVDDKFYVKGKVYAVRNGQKMEN